MRIHYTEIPDRIETYFGDKIKDKHKLDNWDFDLRNQTLLHRNAAGYYDFAHKSLAEYFVAFKFAAELGCLAPAFMETYCEAEGKSCKIPIEQKEITGLAETFGAIALTDARMHTVNGLLKEMISEDAAKRLWEVIDETREKTFEQVKYAGGNAATLLRTKGESFEGANMTHTVLAGADLTKCSLSTADLTGCDLSEADLTRSLFTEDMLRSVKLQQTLMRTIGVGESDLGHKTIEAVESESSEDSRFDDIFSNMAQKFNVDGGMYSETSGKFIFIIDFKTDEIDYKKVRDELSKDPIIQHVALYETEIEELKRYLPRELGVNLAIWEIE